MLVEFAALRRQRLLSDDLALGLTALTELRARPPSHAHAGRGANPTVDGAGGSVEERMDFVEDPQCASKYP